MSFLRHLFVYYFTHESSKLTSLPIYFPKTNPKPTIYSNASASNSASLTGTIITTAVCNLDKALPVFIKFGIRVSPVKRTRTRAVGVTNPPKISLACVHKQSDQLVSRLPRKTPMY